MPITDYIELALGWTFPIKTPNPHDQKLFKTRPCITSSTCTTPTIKITCPETTASSSSPDALHQLLKDHSQDGSIPRGKFPTLEWELENDEVGKEIKDWVLVVEDPDAPLPTPALHGIYYSFPSSTRGVKHEDFAAVNEKGKKAGNELRGGFKYGKNLRGIIYAGPKPLLNHGPHRYVFTVVALGKRLEEMGVGVGGKLPSRDEIAKGCEGNVVGWGEWVGVYERKWE